MASKGSKRRAKAAVEFELNPPRCGSCAHYSPLVTGTPQNDALGIRFTPYQNPYCKKHNFACQNHSICNDWQHGKTGETLDD